ncbi:hypothetical protein QFC21_003258 [Naganishia friedmannii]|uniref:Uncharacterized protein n=1 Tax=Naganishia friedmannii TaxID=89922 RepID=A0ACC2VQ76_9TREE|nr:hypothetical protein QFC21_003258 [Naganishia friedmannii]
MFGSAHTLRASVLLLGGIALLSGTIARVLPKVKRDNSSCGCYQLTNRGNTRFRYEHVIDFSALKTLDDVTTAGWGLSNGWQVGGVNPTTGQHSMANENNVKLIPGVGLTLTVPGGGYFEVEAKVTAVAGVVLGIFTMHGDPNNAPLGWQDEQDLEVPSSTITKANSFNAAGAQLTNFDPAEFFKNPLVPQHIPESLDLVLDFLVAYFNMPGSVPTRFKHQISLQWQHFGSFACHRVLDASLSIHHKCVDQCRPQI